MKDLSKYPGLLKMCGYCSKKVKRDGLKPDQYICLESGRAISSDSDEAMICEEFDGANIDIP